MCVGTDLIPYMDHMIYLFVADFAADTLDFTSTGAGFGTFSTGSRAGSSLYASLIRSRGSSGLSSTRFGGLPSTTGATANKWDHVLSLEKICKTMCFEMVHMFSIDQQNLIYLYLLALLCFCSSPARFPETRNVECFIAWRWYSIFVVDRNFIKN